LNNAVSDSPKTVLSSAKLALAIKQLRAENSDLSLLGSDPIAIVGIGCNFPGGIRSADQYWQLLRDGVDAITTIPADRWDAEAYFDTDPQASGKINSRWGGFVPDVDLFDPVFFGIAPREAANIDPQQRLLLEVVWEAIWNSGRSPQSLGGSRTGVFVAICSSDYERLVFDDITLIGPQSCAGAYHSIASGRLSFLLNLRGPSISIDTACSSSLTTVHIACQSLRTGECNLALAGGVNLHLLPEHYIGLSKLGMLSPDGRCKTFDSQANGFVPSEGCGVVVLKPLADALRDGDRVYAVIRGTAVNQDGCTNVLTAPNGLAQQEVIRAALKNGHVAPSSISYVETHGTGTALGDPIEVEALAEVLGAESPEAGRCALGAVKSNLGHLEAAAGIAGLIKAALALDREEIPPNLHYSELNPHITLENTRFYLPTQRTPWPRGSRGRFAGISSFGFGGTNAHVVLEEAPSTPQPRQLDKSSSRNTFLLPISARTREALRDFATLHQEFLVSPNAKQTNLYDICHSAATRRHSYEERLTVSGSTHEDLSQRLGDFLSGRASRNLAVGRASLEGESVVFVCSGQGSQWPRMGMSLVEREPAFRKAIEECEEWIKRYAGWSLIDELSAREESSKLQHTEYAQPAIFAVEVALARLWHSWGVTPAAIIGHSAGEVAAAYIAGILELEEAARIVVLRGRLMEPSTGQGKMAAVHLPLPSVAEQIKVFGESVSVAASNSPESTVISGDPDSVQQLTDEWLRKGIGCRMLPVNYAFHSSQMQPFSDELARTLGSVKTRKQTTPMISTVLGAVTDCAMFDATYWARNVRLPVLFATAVNVAMRMGFRTFLEVGPHPVLLGNVGECLGQNTGQESLVPSLHRNRDEPSDMLSSLGKLYVAGCSVEWNSVYATRVPSVSLPAYPYQRQKYWINRRTKTTPNALHPLLGRRLSSPALQGTVFEAELDISTLPYLTDHQIDGSVLLPMTAFLEIAHSAVSKASGEARALIGVTVLSPLVLPESGSCRIQAVVEGDSVKVFGLDSQKWKLHANCKLGEMSSTAEPDSLSKLVASYESMDPNSFYARLHENLVEFGPSFRVLENLHAGVGSALGHVRLSKREQSDAVRYHIHPALLDGCFQTAIAAVPKEFSGTYLPFGIDRFEAFGQGEGDAWAHVRMSDLREGNDTLSADIDVFTDEGRLLARVRGLHFKRRTSRASFNEKIYQVQWHRTSHRSPTPIQATNWSIISDKESDGKKLAEAMTEQGYRAVLSKRGESIAEAKTFDGVIRMFTDTTSGTQPDEQSRACASVLRLTHELVGSASPTLPRLCLVTCGAVFALPLDRGEGLSQSSIWGLGRTIALEHPDLHCRRVDLDPAGIDFAALAQEITCEASEEEIAFRGGERYIPRLERKLLRENRPQRLIVSERGSLENLAIEPVDRRDPSPGEVEVEVETTGLNFRDVLNALGTYPGNPGPLGLEFCGRIARVGRGVTYHRPGDRVMGIAWGSFASFVNTPVELVARVPAGLNATEAVSIPNAFLTAYHCLVELGGIKPGDRVLIHAATGGVGLAAVQLAQHAGAEIFATAGSTAKREYLRSLGIKHIFSSRTLDFARDIREVTGGRGVDLVLNSLAGDFIGAGFSVLAEGGRFVEIGKTGIWSSDQVAALGKPVHYDVVDLGPMIDSDPTRMKVYLSAICNLMAEGSLRPLPTIVFEFEDSATAFRHMAQAKHIGKIVLRHSLIFRLSSDATYLVTGGLGAIGLQTAEWMANQGARNLMLMGRGAPGTETLARIEKMRRTGARIEIRATDVGDRTQLDLLWHEMRESMPPLRGLVHCAGILDDGVIAQQTPERFERVLSPKVKGAWNLHELTESMPLDFFVLCSSVASVTGSPSQSAYAAGNAFLDALAYFRRSRGLAALSVNWGAWADSGMAARVEAQGRRRVLSGIRPMSSADCFKCFEEAAAAGASQLVVAEVDWTRWENPAPMISGLVNSEAIPETQTPQNGILARLENVPTSNRRRVFIDYLREEALRVLALSESYFIDERQPLLKMGLDSLMAVEFRNRLTVALNRSLSTTLLFDYPTLGGLADYLDSGVAPVQQESIDPLLGSIGSLSDAQAEELLREELGQSS
jgi:acyl transferase domain-containing protein/NADPH:quinone reductase-like Zn-dependent oxidoreductase/NAD(P)-dependent dehydrogenase (short-subunit alcohol dehydrogenase family)